MGYIITTPIVITHFDFCLTFYELITLRFGLFG